MSKNNLTVINQSHHLKVKTDISKTYAPRTQRSLATPTKLLISPKYPSMLKTALRI